jgi:glutamate-1-semialdehyde 2,1-aminomutase
LLWNIEMTTKAVVTHPSEEILRIFQGRTMRSRAAHSRASKHLPGGINRNITYFAPHPVFFERGEGAYVFDIDGNRYLDCLGNYTSMILGHSHPEVVAAVRAQLSQGTSWGGATTTELVLAELLAERLPSMEMTRFTASGTEATMMAMRAARAVTGRRLIAKFEGAYHGSHDYATISLAPSLAQAGPAERPRSVPPTGVPEDIGETVVVLPFNNPDAVEEILDIHGCALAAVIVEPVMGVAGIIEPTRDFLTRLRTAANRHGIVLIFDEVISFRLAYGGAQSVYDVRPDLTTLGKIIGGGFPIGAVGGRSDIMKVFNPAEPDHIVLSGTFHANPVALQAGIATIKILSSEVLGQLNADSQLLFRDIRQVLVDGTGSAHLNAAGSLFNIHLGSMPVTDYRSSLSTDKEAHRWLHLAMLNEGVLLAPRGLGCLSVPMTDADRDRLLTALGRALASLGEVS